MRRFNKIGLPLLFPALFLLLIFAYSCNQADEKTVEVDFDERVQTRGERKSDDTETVRAALAALISPKETAAFYGEMMHYVGKKLGVHVEIVQRKTYREVNDLIERREIDFAFICAGPYVKGHEKFRMELLAAPLLYGKPFYQAYFIVHKDSSINDIKGLRGKRFAFTDPDSNTGRLVPTYVLSKMGETPEKYFKEFIFTYSHDNSIKAVARGLVDGASVDGLIWEYFNDRKPEMVKKTKIIYKSPFFGIPPVVVHPRMPSGMKERLRKIFLEMHKDPRGMDILSKLKIEKFIVPKDSSYDSVRRMRKWIETRK